jgi:hypothetical protein
MLGVEDGSAAHHRLLSDEPICSAGR